MEMKVWVQNLPLGDIDCFVATWKELVSFPFFFWVEHVVYGGSQVRGWIGAVAASLCHSHSNTGSELNLSPTSQLTATPDPRPTEQGQGSNMHPHKHYVGFLSPWATIRTPKMFNSWDSIGLTVCTGICSWIQQPASHCWQILHWNVTDLSIYLVKCELISH